jgi:signal peptidase I
VSSDGWPPTPGAAEPPAPSPDPYGDPFFPPAEVVWPSDTAPEHAAVTGSTRPFMLHRLSVWGDEIVAWLRTLVSAGVYAILIVTFGFQVARVEGSSMEPTLVNDDRLIVNKLAYRFGPPRRDDIVMLYYPPDPDKSFVKRVIAEEGQLVKIEDGRVYVNDVPIDDDYVPAGYRDEDDYPATLVNDGYYFVMGDHRKNSSDSRIWGQVPKKYITGKVQLRWWPVQNARLF